ncbi:hypothetical protein evm_000298 [Chilo suppressalis]|nr:hypothetical protein evm_000298 [Chilo suppressalis]
MRRLMLGLAMATLAMARPELYREKEDFQYSRSSSDDGTKSGFYDAQRGNMGGNYEKAHNMDTLAQHQMGGLVRQVEGELGDGSKTRTGSVFSAANSRGVYGSGHYDLSNLAGRNFQEGASYGESHQASSSNSAYTAHLSSSNNEKYRVGAAHSLNSGSLQASSLNNAYAANLASNNDERYRTSGGHSLNSGYRGYQSSNLHDEQNLYGANQFEQGMQAGRSSIYHSQSGFGQNLYGQRQVNTDQSAVQNMDSNTHHRLVSTVPVKIIVRPGQSIAVPIATQTHGEQVEGSAISDANALLYINQQTLKPSNTGKHYESSYSYRKEWEKHNTRPSVLPLAVSTITPILKNSELYDDSYAQRSTQNSQNSYEQNANYNVAASQSHFQTDLNARHHSSASSDSNLNAYSQSGANSKADSQSANLIGVGNSKPKSYQSSYSYHKSWERQGDPYIIKPAYNSGYEAQTSGKLTDASASQAAAYSSYNYGSRQMQNQQRYSSTNCITECEPSYTRVARSYDTNKDQFEQQNENIEDLGQQTQNQWDNLAELGQQTQDHWIDADHFGQQTENKANLEDFGQQTQDTWSQAENNGQQTESKLDHIEDLGQNTQNIFDNLEDLGQQVQTKWDTNSASQNSQSQSSYNEDLGQQSQNQWNADNTGQAKENKSEQLEDLGQEAQTKWDSDSVGQQTQDFGQTQMDNGQQMQDFWGKLDNNDQPKTIELFGVQQSENKWDAINTQEMGHSQASMDQTRSYWQNLGDLEQAQKSNINEENLSAQHSFQSHDMTQQTSGVWEIHNQDNLFPGNNEGRDFYSNNFQSTLKPQNTGSLNSLWGKLDNLDDDHTQYNTNNENINFSQSSNSQQFNNNWHGQETYHQTVTNTDSNIKNLSYTDFETSNKHEASTEKLTEQGNVLNEIEILDVKTTTQKIYTANNGLPKTFEDKEKQITTTTEKEKYTNDFRPIDIGRGDIGPEEPTVDTITTEKSYSGTSDKPNMDTFTFIDNINVPKDQERTEALIKQIKHEMELQSAANVFKQYENKKSELEVMEIPLPEHAKLNITLYTQQNFKAFNNSSFSEINTHNNKEVEEMSPELVPHDAQTAIINQHTAKEIETFDQTKDFIQENQHFIDSMQNFENQINENLSDFNGQSPQSDQQVNWNIDSQNNDQQFLDDFSQQSQAPVKNFDQEFVNFSQQNDKLSHQKPSQSNEQSNLKEFIPEPINLDELPLSNEKSGPYNRHLGVSKSSKEANQNNPEYHVIEIAETQKQDKSQKVVTELSSTETVTEKPGFWKSIGNKFTNAKSKVSSWFGS